MMQVSLSTVLAERSKVEAVFEFSLDWWVGVCLAGKTGGSKSR